jgi:hypothetical protein
MVGLTAVLNKRIFEVTFEEVFEKANNLYPSFYDSNEDYSGEHGLATEDDIRSIERQFDIVFPISFIEYSTKWAKKLPLADFEWDGFAWANPGLDPYMSLSSIIEDARQIGVPKSLVPFRVENGNYFCFDNSNIGDESSVVYWDHHGPTISFEFANFIEWFLAGIQSEEKWSSE